MAKHSGARAGGPALQHLRANRVVLGHDCVLRPDPAQAHASPVARIVHLRIEDLRNIDCGRAFDFEGTAAALVAPVLAIYLRCGRRASLRLGRRSGIMEGERAVASVQCLARRRS